MPDVVFLSSKGVHVEVIEYLKDRFQCIFVPLNTKCYETICHHVDIQVTKILNRIFMDDVTFNVLEPVLLALHGAKADKINHKIIYKKVEILGVPTNLGNKYPDSAIMNNRAVGDLYVHNLTITAPIIMDYVISQKLRRIHTKQGYTGCNLILLDETAGITSDPGLAKTLINEGLEILLIRQGDILLQGFDFGFIGGTAVVADKEVIFNGDLLKHPDAAAISDFIKERGFDIVSFNGLPLVDVGSFVII